MECLDADHDYHVVPKEKVAALTSVLADRTAKDPVPHAHTAHSLGLLAARVASAGKELHILMPGCNTIRLVQQLHAAVPEDIRQHVWVLCTDSVWPSDLAPFLWHHYGTLAQRGDLQGFRSATRTLLGEYTDHYKRQRIEDESLREARAKQTEVGGTEESLANAAYLDRLDRVKLEAGRNAQMMGL
jgi:hypothetical protein